MTTPSPGFGRCPQCREPVLFALAVSGDVLSLDKAWDDDGTHVVAWDCTGTPRVRPARGRVGASEHQYTRHVVACSALAPVAAIGSAKSVRSRRPVRTDTTPRRANAR
jgi:hypothetical protein